MHVCDAGYSTRLQSFECNFLVLFLTSNSLSCVSLVRHDNHVGRWLTSFRSTWDPKFDKYAVVGSMKKPRQVGMLLSSSYVGAVLFFL